jgi:hypothetical protein
VVKLIVNHLIVTIPRTGSHFLHNLIYQKIDYRYYVEKTHTFPKQHKNVITTARDPKDAILSDLTMNKNAGLSVTEVNVFGHINNYVSLGKKLYNEAKIIIDYNDLINYPNEVIKYIAKDMQRPYKDIEYKDDLKDNLENNYLVSSKNNKHYTELKPLIDSLDFTKAYEVYHKMLSKAIKIKTDGI